MAAPEYVPNDLARQPRRGLALPPPKGWLADRPGELAPGRPTGPELGSPGPDQGYALTLARRFDGRLVLAEGEHRDDVVAGCVAVAMKRASMFGRAPVIHDLDVAFGLWGFLETAPPELVTFRRPLFEGAAHHYWEGRRVVDLTPEETLRLAPASIRERVAAGDWRTLLGR